MKSLSTSICVLAVVALLAADLSAQAVGVIGPQRDTGPTTVSTVATPPPSRDLGPPMINYRAGSAGNSHLVIDNVPPDGRVYLLISSSRDEQPFRDVTIVPSLQPGRLLLIPAIADGDGKLRIEGSLPAGSDLFVQVVVPDRRARSGVRVSDTLRIQTP